jgi:Domain of unknown function (DUF382)
VFALLCLLHNVALRPDVCSCTAVAAQHHAGAPPLEPKTEVPPGVGLLPPHRMVSWRCQTCAVMHICPGRSCGTRRDGRVVCGRTQGKRGIEKPAFVLPDFIEATGISDMRSAYKEKEEGKKLKQKQRDRMTVRMLQLGKTLK